MTYSCGTSTTDIPYQVNTNCKEFDSCCLNCNSCKVTKKLCHKSINTFNMPQDKNLDARQQLKQKKIQFSYLN